MRADRGLEKTLEQLLGVPGPSWSIKGLLSQPFITELIAKKWYFPKEIDIVIDVRTSITFHVLYLVPHRI